MDPRDYDSFFLWSGVRPPDHLPEAASVYVLWGELRADDPSRIVALRREVPRNPGPPLWLVIRAERLDWGADAYLQLLAETKCRGVEIDLNADQGITGPTPAFCLGEKL